MVSFKCLTYGRVAFLEEALQSFLLQEENDAELVIVNDYPLQTLIFDHPQVRIFNLKETFSLIGEKENFTIEKCNGDLIATADDDDVFLPWHLKNIKKYWKDDTNILHWANGAYYNTPKITKLCYVGNSGMVHSKKAWEAIGKSPQINACGDSILRNKIHDLGSQYIVNAHPPDTEVSWFYRWHMPQNGGVYHQSGQSFDTPDRPNIIQRHSLHVENLRLKGFIPTGIVELKPHWDLDYQKMLEDFVKK